jgi:2-oxoglutarate ferredoxin oxidoreductase subunit gamma
MATTNLLFAGFGGQGILFSGKFLAYKGLIEDRQVSWLPSYGPEMRGGTANCSVIISDEPVGSPIVGNPDVLIAMNLPSLDKYEDAVVPGGKIFVDSTLIGRKVRRTDVEVHYIPATQMASDNQMPTLANMIIMGKVLQACPELGATHIQEALKKVVSARHQDLLAVNEKALQLGAEYQA